MADITDPLDRKYLVTDLLHEESSDENRSVDSDEAPQLVEIEEEDLTDAQLRDLEIRRQMEKDHNNLPEWQKLQMELSKTRLRNNNGPKGVLQDYKEGQEIKKMLQENSDLRKKESLKRKTEHTFSPGVENIKQVSKYEYLDVIENVKELDTFVVVHLFEEYIRACGKLDLLMKQAQHFVSNSQKEPNVIFVKLNATEADPTLTHLALPALLVYKGGELVNEASMKLEDTLFKKHPEGPENFSVENFITFLSKRYSIPFPSMEEAPEEEEVDYDFQAENGKVTFTKNKIYNNDSEDDDWIF
eukprot:snap_masked-scaffold_11-processed-gene-1.16-mRNA-1 protein AED:1.00 eAED:1.00 QI:0/0/0/0/1/1/2/0/300